MRTSAGFFMSRENRVYDKPPLTIDGMLDLLESRNLKFKDRATAENYLRFISYYRLSGYAYLLEEEHMNGCRSHCFRQGTYFEDLLQLYVFDRHLRLLVIDAIERIEVAIRTVIAHELSVKYESGDWLLNARLFKESRHFTHKKLVEIIKKDTAYNSEIGTAIYSGRAPFITHYYQNYDSPKYPPVWMLTETLTLGTWSKIYENLAISKDRKIISRIFDLSPETLESWLHSLTHLRNLCAHHSQIYGRNLAFPPQNKSNWPDLPRKSFGRFILMMNYMMQKISPNSLWVVRLQKLIEDNKTLINPTILGISSENFWHQKL